MTKEKDICVQKVKQYATSIAAETASVLVIVGERQVCKYAGNWCFSRIGLKYTATVRPLRRAH